LTRCERACVIFNGDMCQEVWWLVWLVCVFVLHAVMRGFRTVSCGRGRMASCVEAWLKSLEKAWKSRLGRRRGKLGRTFGCRRALPNLSIEEMAVGYHGCW